MRRGLYRSEKNGQKEIPQNSTSAEDTFPPAITQEYDRYLHHAVASFPDKVFSVLNNDLIKAGFIRDVRRLAKKDVRAAIKLVAEANAAAQNMRANRSLRLATASMRSWQPLPKVSIERKPRHPTHRPKPDFSALRNKPATPRPALLFTLSNWQNGSNEMHFKV